MTIRPDPDLFIFTFGSINTDPDPAKVCRSDLIQIRLILHLLEMKTDSDPAK
jgi:hypothetical protein